MNIVTLIFCSAIVAFGVWVIRKSEQSYQRVVGQLYEAADAQLKAIEVHSKDERFAFTGLTAEIVDEAVRVRDNENVVFDLHLERYYRNSYGEYFFVISNKDMKPFIKHVPHNIARIALKAKYVPSKSVG